MIEINGLTKTFGNITVVDNLSFDVAPGEVLGFLGPNGAGKSTTMKMITGFLAPSKGSIKIFNYDVEQNPIQAKELIGYLPEGAPSYGEMSTLQFLSFVAEIRGYRGAEKHRRIMHSVEQVALQQVLDQPIETLSKGFKRRVGLAQAFIHDPKVLILDEPTDGLDPNQKHQVRNLIKDLAKDKIVIISTHILEEVSAVCTKASIISDGKLVFNGTPLELEGRSRFHNAISLSFPSKTANDQYDEAIAAFSAIKDIAAVERQKKGLMLFPRKGQTIYPQVDGVLREKGWTASTLHVERGRLDDVFRTVTAGE